MANEDKTEERYSNAFSSLLVAMRILGLDFNVEYRRTNIEAEENVFKNEELRQTKLKKSFHETKVIEVANYPHDREEDISCPSDPEGNECFHKPQADVDVRDVREKTYSANVQTKKRIFILTVLRRCYSFCFVLVTWFNCLKMAPTFFSTNQVNEQLFSFKVVYMMWTAQVAISGCIVFKISFTDWLPSILKLLDDYRSKIAAFRVKSPNRKLQISKYVRWATFACTCNCVLSAIIAPVIYVADEGGKTFIELIIISPFSSQPGPFLIMDILIVCSCASWIFILSFVILLSKSIGDNLAELSVAMTSHIEKDETEFCRQLHIYRRLYLDLSHLVTVADTYLSLLLAVCVTANIGINIFGVYVIVSGKYQFSFLAPLLVWIIGNLIGFFAMTVYCSNIHSKAQSPLFTLLKVRSATKNPEQVAELSLFLQAIIHGNVGISVMGMFNITKESILTIVGVVVSYFFVIIQFNFK